MVEHKRGLDFNSHHARTERPSHTPNGHAKDLLNPDTPVEKLRRYLLNPDIYVHRPQGRSRNSGPRSR